MPIVLLSFLAIVLYSVSSALLVRRLLRHAVGERPPHLSLFLGLAAVGLHGAVLFHLVFSAQGLDLSFFKAASLVSWLAALLVLLAAMSRPVENLGIAVLPLAALLLLLTELSPVQPDTLRDVPAELEWHIVLSILAYSLLSIAALQAALLYVQDRHLHNKQPGGFIRALPPLQTMESLLFQMIALGFVVLSLALLSGMVAIDDLFAQHLVHKTVLSILAWVVFGVLLWGRWQFGWRGRTAIRWSLTGFVVLMLAYFGSKLVLEFILHR